MNYSTQIRIDITISGSIFSGDGLFYTHSTLPSALAEDNYMDYIVDATFATYTVVPAVSAVSCALRKQVPNVNCSRITDSMKQRGILTIKFDLKPLASNLPGSLA